MDRRTLAWRLGARAGDVIILGWVLAVVFVEVEHNLLGTDLGVFGGYRSLVIAGPVLFAAEVVPLVAGGWTPGKLLLGLHVERTAGPGPIPLPAALVRALVLYGVVLVPVAGWILLAANVALVAATGRGLHDRAAGTTVVLTPDRHTQPQEPH